MPPARRFPKLASEIAGVPVADLVRDFGTPTFVYDAAGIEERVRRLGAFDVVRYAQKANSNLAVLDVVRRAGALVDAVSAGEIHRALAAGYPAEGEPAPIVYTADLFDRDALAVVAEHAIPVNLGSADMIEQYAALRAAHPRLTADVTLRVNPGFGHGHSRKTNTGGEHSKHGIWHAELPAVLERVRRAGLRATCIHVHIGSGVDLEHLALVAGAATAFARQVGPDITALSAGGGLPTPYRDGDPSSTSPPTSRSGTASAGSSPTELGHPIRLEIEPGRYLVAESGWLVAEIRAVKRQGANLFYVLDAGFNNLARPILYGAYHPMAVAPRDGIGERPLRDVVVGGPLCESGDIFTQDADGVVRTEPLPEAKVGDWLLIGCAGAYAFVMGSNYNGKPKAAEVMIVRGKPYGVRARRPSTI